MHDLLGFTYYLGVKVTHNLLSNFFLLFLLSYNVSLLLHCKKNQIFFFQMFWKDGLSKKSHWNMIFLVLSWKVIFLFPENMTLFFRHKRKDDLSQKNTWKYDIFFRCFGNMVFPDNSLLNTIFFVISEFLWILRNFEEHDFLQNTPGDCFWSSNYFLFFYEDLL